jgi:hypothetical protein
MITIFGDESYDEQKRRVFAIAVVFATSEQWAKLQDTWLDRTHGITIHSAELESDRGYFKSHTHSDNLALYKDLITIVAESEIRSFSASMDIRKMDELFPGSVKQQPYFHCFIEALIACAEGIKPTSMDDLEIIFDRNQESATGARILFDSLVSSNGWKESGLIPNRLSFESRERYVGLQVADIVARETMKAMDNIQQGEPLPPRKSIEALHKTGRFHSNHFTEEYFIGMKAFMDSDPLFSTAWKAYRKWLSDNGLQDHARLRFLYASKYRESSL